MTGNDSNEIPPLYFGTLPIKLTLVTLLRDLEALLDVNPTILEKDIVFCYPRVTYRRLTLPEPTSWTTYDFNKYFMILQAI